MNSGTGSYWRSNPDHRILGMNAALRTQKLSKQTKNLYFKQIFMKRLFLAILLGTLIVSGAGCVKGTQVTPCTNKTPESEEAAILAYAASKNYNVLRHPSGMYYEVVQPGNGAIPLPTSRVYVTYTGRLISSDAIFDSQTNHTLTGWVLETLIPGWQLGLPIIAVGGKIRLIVPSSLAYGCRPYQTLPGDAVLFFEIDLVDIS
jgi:FKBP-type peptidyl-prolyl cis-trans isomerase FkpA